jgi:hypothetical protein
MSVHAWPREQICQRSDRLNAGAIDSPPGEPLESQENGIGEHPHENPVDKDISDGNRDDGQNDKRKPVQASAAAYN